LEPFAGGMFNYNAQEKYNPLCVVLASIRCERYNTCKSNKSQALMMEACSEKSVHIYYNTRRHTQNKSVTADHT
jgi:hypothetical protein